MCLFPRFSRAEFWQQRTHVDGGVGDTRRSLADVFLWGYLKAKVFPSNIWNIQEPEGGEPESTFNK